MTKDRTDAKKNKAKIVTEIIKQPLATQREIAERVGCGKTTVQEHMREIASNSTKDDRIIGICEKDLETVLIGQSEITRRLQDSEELSKMRTTEISQVIKESTARYALFKGQATDADGGLRAFTQIDVIINRE